jgi:hypothetical protein
MRFVGIILVFALFPFFLWLLQQRQGHRWAILALGALPILDMPLNLDAALINWATWPGHTKGLILTLLDPLAFAACIHFKSGKRLPPLAWAFALYVISLIPGLFSGTLFQPAMFFFFQALRITLYFFACYCVVLDGHLQNLARGFAVAIILNGLVAVKAALLGATQAPGLLGHQNLTGMAVNICVPLLVVLGLRKRGRLFLIAVAAAGASAVAGGSRATIIFYGAAVAATLVWSTLTNPNSRTTTITLFGLLALVVATPFAVHKLNERSSILAPDLERLAFERAARMMIKEHPWGVGINQYVVVSNTQGYASRAGVRWGAGARATNVHNFYLLARAEGGFSELIGVLIWLGWPAFIAFVLALRKKTPSRDICAAIGTALVITALHNRYEWIFVTTIPQYLTAGVSGILAAIHVAAGRTARAKSPPKMEAERRESTRSAEPQSV